MRDGRARDEGRAVADPVPGGQLQDADRARLEGHDRAQARRGVRRWRPAGRARRGRARRWRCPCAPNPSGRRRRPARRRSPRGGGGPRRGRRPRPTASDRTARSRRREPLVLGRGRWPGSSAAARCVQTPPRRTPGAAHAIASTSGRRVGRDARPRVRGPVSTSRWTLERRAASAGRRARRSRSPASPGPRLTAMPAAAASARRGRRGSGTGRGAGRVTPASRSSNASSRVATDRPSAPAASSARATGTAPCP